MGKNSAIAWTTHTFNPWMGCTKVAEECRNCYAEAQMDKRWGKVQWGPSGERIRTSKSNWHQPIKWNDEAAGLAERPRVFCASLADVFEDRPELEPWRMDLFAIIDITPNLDWMLLTKRPENIRKMWCGGRRENVWLGTSAGTQRTASLSIPHLQGCRGLGRFLFISAEPLLERTNFRLGVYMQTDGGRGFYGTSLDGIDLLIVGCESDGKVAGRFADGYEDAARFAIQQGQSAGCAVFHKQMPIAGRVSHNMADWPEPLRVRQMPKGGA